MPQDEGTYGYYDFTPSGSPGDSTDPTSASKVPWAKILAGGGAALSSLFAGKGSNINAPIAEIQRGARATSETGRGLVARGTAALDPALQYFTNLLSGNPADLMAATGPQRKRVLDQYDTARKSSAEFTPRGGGQASSQMEARARQASDLAMVGAGARSDAANTVAALGQSEQQAGLTAEAEAQQQLASVLGPLLQQQEQDQNSIVSTFTGIAKLVAPFIFGV